ncbi:phage antirepressor KilAC domain-containing protein, partial [Pantoea agglomerans]|uniref:phage antirepressor KilAC domain-containing protein n=1 Tax=Enterobacter agglomerans TaxID=549 RepID=UPI001F5D539F
AVENLRKSVLDQVIVCDTIPLSQEIKSLPNVRTLTLSGMLSFRQLCKMLKVKEPEFRQFLLERNIMYRAKGTLTPQHYHL